MFNSFGGIEQPPVVTHLSVCLKKTIELFELVNLETGEKGGATVKAVSVETSSGMKLELEFKGNDLTLEVKPTTISHGSVYVNGELDPEARMIFAYKGSIGNPSRWALDIRPFTYLDDEYRANIRFDP